MELNLKGWSMFDIGDVHGVERMLTWLSVSQPLTTDLKNQGQ